LSQRIVRIPATLTIWFAILVGVWQFGTQLLDVPDYIFPSPSAVFFAFAGSAPILLHHGAITAVEAIGGLILGSIAGIALAIAMVESKMLERLLVPLLVIDQSIPKLALAPLLIVWFGYGVRPKVFIAALISFFPLSMGTMRGLSDIEARLLNAMQVIGANRWHVLYRVRLPHATPYILTGLRASIPLAIIGAVVGEFVQSDGGLGYMILTASTELRIPLVFAAIALLAAMSLVAFSSLTTIETLIYRKRFRYLRGDSRNQGLLGRQK
jgi:NitT/TauT family transport system permease protein